MTLRRHIVCLAALLALLASGMGLRVAEAGHACDGMTMSSAMAGCDHQPVDSAAAADCATFICAAVQPALPPTGGVHHTALYASSAPALSGDDARREDLRGPPDLRPPKA